MNNDQKAVRDAIVHFGFPHHEDNNFYSVDAVIRHAKNVMHPLEWHKKFADFNDHYAVTNAGKRSDGSTADYYQLPSGATELQDLISHRDMNAQLGEIFRSCYRYGIASHSGKLRDAKKIKFYIDAEITRLQKLSKEGDDYEHQTTG